MNTNIKIPEFIKYALPPLLLGLHPLINIYLTNSVYFDWYEFVVPFFINILMPFLIFYLMGLIVRNNIKASVLAFISVGYILNAKLISDGFCYIVNSTIFGVKTTVNVLPVNYEILVFLIFGFVFYKTLKANTGLKIIQEILLNISVLMIVFSMVISPVKLYIAYLNTVSWIDFLNRPKIEKISPEEKQKNSPDIYYIILDAYAGPETLKNCYDYDNSGFYKWLEGKGFYVADDSKSNYAKTMFSMSSSLNTRYINDDVKKHINDLHAKLITKYLKLNSSVIKSFRERGYNFYYNDTVTMNFDEFFHIADNKRTFRQYLDEAVFMSYFLYENSIFHGFINKLFIHTAREDLKNLFKWTKNSVNISQSRKFVYVHFQAPHRPFLFNGKGEEIEKVYTMYPPFVRENYREFLVYINERMKEIIGHILENSQNPPIIIIQGDHGPPGIKKTEKSPYCVLEGRTLGIINAYYFPDGNYEGLYETISPVNSFKIIQNKYFSTDYQLEEDISFRTIQKK